MVTEVFNRNGKSVRQLNEPDNGCLAKKYRNYADKVMYTWPRTAIMLRNIAEDFERSTKLETQIQNQE
jgi:hypothetical protein